MNSEKAASIATYPFINKFVLTIIKTIRSHHLNHEKREVINSDLVPNLSESVMHASLGEQKIPATHEMKVPEPQKHEHRDMSMLIAPINSRQIHRKPMHLQPAPRPQQKPLVMQSQDAMPPKPMVIQRPQAETVPEPPSAPVNNIGGPVQLGEGYGKITPLLNDPSVSSIECAGAGKPLMIIRMGQRQVTRIVLSKDDINAILEKISDTIHIPLLEGVFRAAADNFTINAVISEMIGSRFVIKKNTPYALLERQQ